MVLASEAFREASPVKPVGELVACLDSINALACFQSYKAETWARLSVKSGARVLDVGCGVGYDVIGLAQRHPAAAIAGVDVSEAMLQVARRRAKGLRNAAFAVANGAELPFADGAFDAVRIDRSLQHAERPERIVQEMARVTKGGGVLLAAEPDWGTFVLSNGDDKTGDLLAAAWTKSIRNAFLGRALQRLLVSCGAQDVRARAHPLVLTDYRSADAVYDLDRLLARCVATDTIPQAKAQDWKARSEKASQAGAFFSHLSIIEVAGVMPVARRRAGEDA